MAWIAYGPDRSCIQYREVTPGIVEIVGGTFDGHTLDYRDKVAGIQDDGDRRGHLVASLAADCWPLGRAAKRVARSFAGSVA